MAKKGFLLTGVHPEIVDFGSRQGRRRSAPTSRIEKIRERSIGPKDAVSAWTRTYILLSNSLPCQGHLYLDLSQKRNRSNQWKWNYFT